MTKFVDTRVQMAKSELRETLGAVKAAIPLAVMAVALLVLGLLLLTLALVSVIMAAFAGSPFAWFYASSRRFFLSAPLPPEQSADS